MSAAGRFKVICLPAGPGSKKAALQRLWLGRQDSNLDNEIQSLARCHYATPQYVTMASSIAG